VIQELQKDPKTWVYMEKFFMFGEIESIMKNGILGGGVKKPFPPKWN